MNDSELFFAALSRASNHGESREVAALRRYVHAEMLAGRIEGATTDRLGELIDALSDKETSQVGDLIGPNATDIRWDVLEVEDNQGGVWRRAFGEDRYCREDGDPDGHEYDWVTVGGGWSSTDGLIVYAPLRITRVARRPGLED